MSFTQKIRLFLWSILALAISLILYLAINPTGKAAYYYRPGETNYFINKLTPAERLKREGGKEEIIGDPVYFSLRTPRRFDRAHLSFKYIDNCQNNCPVIEAGVLTHNKIWPYALLPIENKIIESVKDWSMKREGDAVLLQRQERFASVSDFLTNPPASDEIATYNFSLKSDFILPEYKASEKVREINHSLSGSYQFFTYLKHENLNFNFTFSDLNKSSGLDEIDITIFKDGNVIKKSRLDDDGDKTDSAKIYKNRELVLEEKNLPEGVYKIEVKTTNDVVTEKISTSQSKLSFINKIKLAETPKKKIEIFSNSRLISFLTSNPASLQTVHINSQEFLIKETYKQISLLMKEESKLKKILLEKGDALLSGDGAFAFSEDELIFPSIKKITKDTDLDDEKINFIIAGYAFSNVENGIKTATVDFDLSNAFRERGRYGFILSIPGLRGERGLEIKEINIELKGSNLFDYIDQKIKKWTEKK